MSWFLSGLRREAIRLAKKYKRIREHELLIINSPRSDRAENEATKMLDTIASRADLLAEVQDALFLQEALALLTPQQRRVLMATVLEGATGQETAERLGVSQPSVHRMKKRALNRLRKNLIQKRYHHE